MSNPFEQLRAAPLDAQQHQKENPLQAFGENVADSFVYTLLQSPINAVAQVADHATGSHQLHEMHLVDAPVAQKSFSANWIAQQLGGGMATMGQFAAIAFLASKAHVNPELEGLVAKTTPMSWHTQMAVGAAYGGIFTPVDDQNNFAAHRLENAVTGALTFGLMSQAGNSARILSESKIPLIKDLMTNKVAGNMLVAAGVGFWTPDISTFVREGHGATEQERLQSALGMAMISGAMMGGMQLRTKSTTYDINSTARRFWQGDDEAAHRLGIVHVDPPELAYASLQQSAGAEPMTMHLSNPPKETTLQVGQLSSEASETVPQTAGTTDQTRTPRPTEKIQTFIEPTERLKQDLAEAEANASKMEIGDIAWLIGNFPENHPVRSFAEDFPKIKARLPETTPMPSEGRALLQVSQFMNDDSIVGTVATHIRRIWGDNPSFYEPPPRVKALEPEPVKERDHLNIKRSTLVEMLEQYLNTDEPDARMLKAQLGDGYKTMNGSDFAQLYRRTFPGWDIKYAGKFQGEDDFTQG